MNASAAVVPAFVLAAALAGHVLGGEVVPTDGMVITGDTVFVAGTYELPNGVSIGASGVTLDLNGAELVGPGGGSGYGITCIGHDDVTIRGGTVRGYYYGVRVETGSGIEVSGNDLSSNWVDPASLGPGAPFLDINVGADLGDTTNLGGGLFVLDVSGATVTGNVMRLGENGMDLFFVSGSTVDGNDASDNTGWGIHLHGSTGNLISGNAADRCIRDGLGDSAGILLVEGSDGNQVLANTMRGCGDGFFIGNENGCPSNGNVVQGNDGSNAGANAFEATFSSGNEFLDNTAEGSNYGLWLGYSHTGNVVAGNSIRANNVAGIEIEHGQGNTIHDNRIVGNGGAGIVLRTDGQVHFPPGPYPCLDLPDQASSAGYTITDNWITGNFGLGVQLTATIDSLIANNVIAANLGGTATSDGADNAWTTAPAPGENVVGGPMLGGNYWGDYGGVDTDDDGLGDTMVPYTNGGQITPPGDPNPLVGNPDIEDLLDNPTTLLDRAWTDLGRNMRSPDQPFDTANGTHLASDGVELYLLEGTNGTRLDRFDPQTGRYEPRASVPEAVWDGGGLEYAAVAYFAGVGIQLDASTGAGKGPKLYAYDATADEWTRRADALVDGAPVATEAFAYDGDGGLLYATIVAVTNGADAALRRRLAIYDPVADEWLGASSSSGVDFGAGSEAAYHAGRVYVWRGLFSGSAVNGSDSFLLVYDIAEDTWSATASLQESGVVPGFRTGGFDVWGIALAVDAARGQLFVLGGETNRHLYVYDVAADGWAAAPIAVYDGGWGDGLEYVARSQAVYQIDGRTALGNPQGTAVLRRSCPADATGDGNVDVDDLVAVILAWGTDDPDADTTLDGVVDVDDLLEVILRWGGCRS